MGGNSTHNALKHLSVHQKVAGIAVDCYPALHAAHYLCGVALRDFDNAVDFALKEELFCALYICGAVCFKNIGRGGEFCCECAAGVALTVVYDCYRELVEHLFGVAKRVKGGVN